MNRNYISGVSLGEEIPEDSYLKDIPVIQTLMDVERLEFKKKVTFFVGENGTGKSTLLEALAVAHGFNPEGGTKNFNFSTRATHSELSEYIRISRNSYPRDGFFLRAESFYNVASNVDELDEEGGPPLIDSYGGVSLHQQSHGESFLALVQNRFGGHGLYILDEPEAALSPVRLMTLMVEMRRLIQADSQFIIATHSPILMTFPGAEILEFTNGGIRSVGYRETDYYQITRQFLENPERMLSLLFQNM